MRSDFLPLSSKEKNFYQTLYKKFQKYLESGNKSLFRYHIPKGINFDFKAWKALFPSRYKEGFSMFQGDLIYNDPFLAADIPSGSSIGTLSLGGRKKRSKSKRRTTRKKLISKR